MQALSGKILIVDDDPIQRRLLQEAVKKFGYRSKTAENGAEAVRIMSSPEASEIDLIILDMVMPELDGLGVLERLRSDKNATPVIVQTAHGGIDTVVNVMNAGAQDFVVKPVAPERLNVSIRNLLKTSALEGEITRTGRACSEALELGRRVSCVQTDPTAYPSVVSLLVPGAAVASVLDLMTVVEPPLISTKPSAAETSASRPPFSCWRVPALWESRV